MPSKSKKQHNFMEMVAHNPKAAKRVGVPQSVGKEFVEADKGNKSYSRKSHHPGNPGFPSHPKAGTSPVTPDTYSTHESREKEVMGAGYEIHQRAEDKGWSRTPHNFSMSKATTHGYGHSKAQHVGHLRTSGHSGAHRIGKK